LNVLTEVDEDLFDDRISITGYGILVTVKSAPGRRWRGH
jgi:hypothetical protein